MNSTEQQKMISKVNGFCLVFILSLLTLCVLFQLVISDWQTLAGQLLLAVVLFAIAIKMSEWVKPDLPAFTLRVIAILVLFSFLFQAVAPLQHILFAGWFDKWLISSEIFLTGTESSIWLQKITTPWLTEWMMFSYVIYVPLLPAIAFLTYRSAGRTAGEEYLFHIALAYALCYVGFILFPVASPLYYFPEVYTVPLEGGFFAGLSEYMRHSQHYAGGSLPSPHTAAGTVMLAALFRHNRRWFYGLLPVILSLYASTVYGRFHYSWDAVAGIMVGIGVIIFAARTNSVFHNRSIISPKFSLPARPDFIKNIRKE